MKFIATLLLAFCISTAAAAPKRKVIIDQDAFGPAGGEGPQLGGPVQVVFEVDVPCFERMTLDLLTRATG